MIGRGAFVAVWNAATGAAPHVLHHVGPLAGAALLAGAAGKLLFGALGLLAAVPFLLRLHRRFDTWVAPAVGLAAMAAVFSVSTFVVGHALVRDDEPVAPAGPGQAPTPSAHDEHHE